MYLDQKWFCSGDTLIQAIREQETTRHLVAVWRIGQCGVFLKYAGKVIPESVKLISSQIP